MLAPKLSESDVVSIISGVKDVQAIGLGGQKAVFSGEIDGQTYAIKFLDITVDSMPSEDNAPIQEDVMARAKREIDIMNRCETSSLVKLGPIGMTSAECNGRKLLYFTEELIDGTDIFVLLKNAPLSFRDTLKLANDVTVAIEQLSNIGMIHRDIKPKNIMRRSNGGFVLLDTGLAFDLNDVSITAAFTTVGTPIYMSPEQLRNVRRGIDFRSDLFLLGIVLYESLTQQHPYFAPGMSSIQFISNVTNNSVRPIAELRQDVPAALNRIVLRLLAKEPHMRFKSCQSLLDALKKVQEVIS